MEQDETVTELVDYLRVASDAELGRWLETVRVVGMSGIRFSDDAAAIVAEAVRRLQGRGDETET